MLRIAVPNKGSLSEIAAEMLAEAGYSGRRDSRKLVHTDARNGVEFFYLRPRDIATYVGSGALHVGITGRDLLLDSGSAASEIEALDFADSTFRFASPSGGGITELEHLDGKRVATSYPKLVDDFLRARGIVSELVKLDGAVESAVQLGVADAVADVVSTGATLRAAGLEIFGPVILESTAVLIGGPTEHADVERLLRRLRGVLVARKYVIMDYDLPVDQLEAATRVAGGIESPTVSPLKDERWVAVRVMVPSDEANQIMDRLYDLGARAILVTAIHAARL
ncbi:ATP phosphoribosyltransferase [Leucobacter tenebrionis]|uniref:ATP phosphoribosyltransferase n=1 Tax=Leucobacter tenebrionis TaxID=2873270 RepID=UPI001CA66A9A|nr:ATP phosphoribosyltransferase [Leucobacter tenebrionis]QZY51914.1 ATP phosphoribosyltransferase [Leucobacter tenebrionis]